MHAISNRALRWEILPAAQQLRAGAPGTRLEVRAVSVLSVSAAALQPPLRSVQRLLPHRGR